jgi:pyrroline-5-carboxylate reductase
MQNKSIGFVGGGRLTGILLQVLKNKGHILTDTTVSDINEETLNSLKIRFPEITTTSDNSLPVQKDIVFISLHPPVIMDFLKMTGSLIKPDAILISLSPKINISKMKETLGGFDRIVRLLPNSPSIIGKGFCPVHYSNTLNEKDISNLKELFSNFGQIYETAEDKFEAFALTTGMGPTYFTFQIYELIRLAEEFGLNREDILTGLPQMLNGTLELVFDSKLPSEVINDLIPVKPLLDYEPAILEFYREKLPALFNKLKN